MKIYLIFILTLLTLTLGSTQEKHRIRLQATITRDSLTLGEAERIEELLLLFLAKIPKSTMKVSIEDQKRFTPLLIDTVSPSVSPKWRALWKLDTLPRPPISW